MSTGRPTALLLNAGHALDHLFLLIFATAVGAIAADWGMIWQDLMPFAAGAFVMFGLGSLPAGRLGDLWGRRVMMVIFFIGIGASAMLVSLTGGVWTLAAVLTVMTLAAISSSLIFNFTTNGNGQLLGERLRGLIDDPATLGVLLAGVYTIASLAQLVVGKLIDRYPLKWVYLPIAAMQAPLFLLASDAGGWALYAFVLLFMVLVFGAIPFVDAMIVQYVDDRMRSRVAGMRLTVSFGVASLAVYLLGPTVKAAGFGTLLTVMAAISTFTTLCVALLPGRLPAGAPAPLTAAAAAPQR